METENEEVRAAGRTYRTPRRLFAPFGRAEGAGASGAIHWTPCGKCGHDRREQRGEGMGTNGAIRWAPCGNDYAD